MRPERRICGAAVPGTGGPVAGGTVLRYCFLRKLHAGRHLARLGGNILFRWSS